MSGSLFHILGVATESLNNSRMGVDVTGHNISNAHVAGFSRQRVNLQTRDPQQMGKHVFGRGAHVAEVSRAHDKYIEQQLRKEVQTTAEKEATSKGLERLEGLFNPELTSTVRDRFNSFFNSLRELANYPEEPSVRTHVAETASNLTQSIQSAHTGVVQIQRDINDEIVSELSILNQKLFEVATLNQQILELSADGSNPNDLLDRRDALVKDIGSLMDIQCYESARDMLTIRGPGGVLLVDGQYHAQTELTIQGQHAEPRLLVRDFSRQNLVDITDKISSGRVGGLVRVRDDYGQTMRNELNNMAKSFAEAFNAKHREGYGGRDFENMKGRDFFEGLDSPDGEYAAYIRVGAHILSDPFSISGALTPGSPGDNTLATELIKLQYEPVMDDGKSTVLAGYDRFVSKLGVETLRAREDHSASQIMLGQLTAQRESVSGVSLDEEAANLLRYQQLFQASSRLITTTDELMKTVLELKR